MKAAVRAMRETDLDAADRVRRLAFGTFFRLEKPASFREDDGLMRTRFAADPKAAFVAEVEGRIVGSILAMDWGSVGVLGPLTVHPEHWGRGIARELIPRIAALFDARGVRLGALFTHPQSPKHVRLYEDFGFELGSIAAVMAKSLDARGAGADEGARFSRLDPQHRARAVAGCRALAGSLYDGLDLGREIEAVDRLKLGDTILLGEAERIAGFAVCHAGAGSEAGSGTLAVKFAAVRAGAAEDFATLLARCEDLAVRVGATRIVASVNTGRRQAYGFLRARGYRTFMNGVAMYRPDDPGYERPDGFVIDDLR